MMQFEAKAAYYYIALGLARDRACDHLPDRTIVDGVLPGCHRRGRGCCRSDRRECAADQARHLYDQRVSHSARRHLLRPVHLFHRSATAFNFNISVEAALVSIVGGVGTLWGPVIGTVLLEATSALLQSWLGSSFGGVQLTVYSLILIAVILWRPDGLLSVLAEVYAAHRSRGIAADEKGCPRWLRHLLSVISASGSVDCAPFRISAFRLRKTRPSR